MRGRSVTKTLLCSKYLYFRPVQTVHIMLHHLILAWLLLEALGPCCSHVWVVAVTRYLGSLLCNTECIWYWVVCPVTTPNLWVFSPARVRGEGQPVTTLRPGTLSLCPNSRLYKLSAHSLPTVSDIFTLSVVTMPAPHSRSDYGRNIATR